MVTAPVGPEHGIRESVAAVRHTVGALRPAVTHSHLSWADVVTAVATVGSPTALVTTEHGIAVDDLVYHGTVWRARLKALAHTARLRRADAVIAVADSTASSVRAKWHPSRSTPGARHPQRGRPAARPARAATRACTSSRSPGSPPRSGSTTCCARSRCCAPSTREARLTVAGTGPEEVALRDLADDLGLGASATFVGHVDPAPLLAGPTCWCSCRCGRTAPTRCSTRSCTASASSRPRSAATPRSSRPSALVAHDDHARSPGWSPRQGLDPASRPTLPAGWPDRATMCAEVAEVYRAVRGRS